VVRPNVEVISYPVFDVPLMGHQNRKVLVEHLAAFRPTVLHCLCESEAVLVRKISRQMDLPYVLSVNSLQTSRARLSVSTRRCASIIVPARSIAVSVSRTHPKFAGRIKQINVGAFASGEEIHMRKAGRPAGIVTVCPLNKVDYFENLLAAVRHLVIEGYDLMLVIMGSGRAEKHVRRLMATLGLLQRVVILPELDAWHFAVEAADIYVRARAGGAFDPYLLAAMSAGVAVAGCGGGVDDMLVNDQTCVIFEPENELSIYNSLQRLLSRPELARELADAERRYVRENHSPSKMVGETLQSYRDAQQWHKNRRDRLLP
jgi:glycosyltransferase involved in cell wall biosynthesis